MYQRAGLVTQVLVIKPEPRNTTQNISNTQKQNTIQTNQKKRQEESKVLGQIDR
jgi:hypothetical protein